MKTFNLINDVIIKKTSLAFLLFLITVACESNESTNADVLIIPETTSTAGEDLSTPQEGGVELVSGETSVIEEMDKVNLTLRALNPFTGGGVSGLSLNWPPEFSFEPNGELVTDMNGAVNVKIPAHSDYEVALEGTGYKTHHIFGGTGQGDATQLSFVSADSLTQQVFSGLGLEVSEGHGIVVIGLDRPNLSPAIGAQAQLGAEYEKAFYVGQFGPVEGNELVAGAGGFISFANVAVGETDVFVTPPPGERCVLFPRNDWNETIIEDAPSYRIEVYPGEVSIVAFTCQATP